jgi:hypothetical protein
MAMNMHVLSNPLGWFHRNEKKVIGRARRHATLEWDRLQVDLQYTHEVPRLALVKLASSHILQLLGMWGVLRGLDDYMILDEQAFRIGGDQGT